MVEGRSISYRTDLSPHKERDLSQRAFIVGMGIVSPLGLDLPTTWENLKAGKTGISNIDIAGTDIKIAGKVNDFDSKKMLPGGVKIRRISRGVQFGLVAVTEAFQDAGIPTKKEELAAKIDVTRFGVSGGTGIGGTNDFPRVSDLIKDGKKPSPIDILLIEPERIATVVSMHFGLKGPLACATVACAAGNRAISDAYKDILLCDADIMAVVVAEATIDAVSLESFNSASALSRNEDIFSSRPFDSKRNGFVMSEGAACLILAGEEIVKKLRLRPKAELVAYSNTADAGDDTAPTGEGAERAMMIALKRLGKYDPRTVYINAHATSTIKGDEAEILAIRRVFGQDTEKLAISSTKGGTGHLMGAAGAAEAIFCIKALQEGVLPPTINLENPIKEAERLNLVPNEAQVREIHTVMKNSFGFGGINSVTIYKRPD